VSDQTQSAFISYCRDDQEFALRLAKDLKDSGAAVWLDQLDIAPGVPWDNAVEEALRGSQQMLVILTPTSVKSENVRDEISFALRQGKTVIPVLYMECVIPLRLERKQHIDFRANYAKGLETLLKQLHIENPNRTVLDKAAEADAQRLLAWQAREAEAKRLRTLDDHGRDAPRPAQDRPSEINRPGKPGAASWRFRLVFASGVAAIAVMLGLTYLRGSSAPKAATLQPNAPATQPSAQTAPPQPALVSAQPPAQTSGTSAPPTPTREQSTAPNKTGPAALALRGDALFTSQNYDQALPLLTQSCDAGVPLACADLGYMYSHQHGVVQDIAKAVALYTRACDGGLPDGCNDLGWMVQHAPGAGQNNYGEAIALFTKACDGGSAAGCNDLGNMYDGGFGIAANPNKAFALYTKSCNAGYSIGCTDVGMYYSGDKGVTANPELARKYFQKGCRLGDTNGCDQLKAMQQPPSN